MTEAAFAITIEEQAYEQSREFFEQIAVFLDTGEASSMSHSNLERELEKKGRELMRKLLQEHIDRRGPGSCGDSVCGSDDIERTQVKNHHRDLESIFGTVEVNRSGYGKEGVDSLHPLDAELNLPNERYSLELRRRVAEEAAKTSFDETVKTIAKTTGSRLHKRQAEELVVRAARDFDSFYEMRQCTPEIDDDSGKILVISADGKGVVMHTQDLRDQTRKAAEKRGKKMGKRLSPGEKSNSKRMATVASVYTIKPFYREPEDVIDETRCKIAKTKRPSPENKRVWASVEKEAEEVIVDALKEAYHRDGNHEKEWVALVDGNNAQITILRRIAKERGINLTIIVDIMHVIEYLWKAGRVFNKESGDDLEKWIGDRLLNILHGKAGLVAGGMRRSATLRRIPAKEREAVETCATYLHNKSPYLFYNQYLSKGLPIATGVIEGACRHIVKDRMELTGAKWRLTGAEAVLRLRALRSSNDFDEYWEYHEACEYKRNHKNLYAGGNVPSTTSSCPAIRRGKFKVIKQKS